MEHQWGEREEETDPESFSNHYFKICELCGQTLWTCPKPWSTNAHPEPSPECPGKVSISGGMNEGIRTNP